MRSHTILVTGGCGFIGSHVISVLLENNFSVVVVDNLSNSSSESIKRVEVITGRKVELHVIDLVDYKKFEQIFQHYRFDACIHLAGYKSVGESCAHPLKYYQNNLISTLNLISLMEKYQVKKLVFSSSATVYGEPSQLPLTEQSSSGAMNPYGRTKQMTEQILEDFSNSNPTWSIISLRYFNPVGAHESGLIGEDPNGVPNNLMPYIAQVAVGKLPVLKIYGDDYPTPDGTGMRDYIHVMDLAEGHLSALRLLLDPHEGVHVNYKVYNLGTGRPFSVLQMVKTMELVTNRTIQYEIVSRRQGDLASVYANVKLAEQELGWTAKRDLMQMCTDLWNWQTMNPHGYKEVDNIFE